MKSDFIRLRNKAKKNSQELIGKEKTGEKNKHHTKRTQTEDNTDRRMKEYEKNQTELSSLRGITRRHCWLFP